MLKSKPFLMSAECRKSVELAIREVVAYREWHLHAIAVRTNHVHTVVSSGNHPSKSVLNAFKAYATRRLKADNLWSHEHSPWSDKGSRRRIWNETGLAAAIHYVVSGQGGQLPDFD